MANTLCLVESALSADHKMTMFQKRQNYRDGETVTLPEALGGDEGTQVVHRGLGSAKFFFAIL